MSINLTTFIPGTKAKADEVNSNFSILKSAVEEKAGKNGDSSQKFSVANATEPKHAINKGQLSDLSDSLTAQINKIGTKFCVKSGNTANGIGDLFSVDVYEITPKISGTYKNLVIVDYAGNQTTIASTPAKLSLLGSADGTYNIFIKPTGEIYILNNTIYVQAKRPTMVVNDVWLDISCEPLNCVKYSGSSDAVFQDIPLGKVVFKSGAITSIETFPFNQNKYSVNVQTELRAGTVLANSICGLCMPDWVNGVDKAFSTTYVAESYGYIYVIGSTAVARSVIIDGVSIQYAGGTVDNAATTVFLPIAKGSTYKVTSGSVLKFFPMKNV